MKHLHKFASVLLALVMAFSLMAPAFATLNEGGETTTPPPSQTEGEGTGTGETETPPAATTTNGTGTEVTGPFDININGATDGHTYAAFQIFTGNLSVAKPADQTGTELTDPTLSNVEWAAGIDNTQACDAANTVFGLSDTDALKSAAQVAAKLAEYETNSEIAHAFAQAMASVVGTTPASTAKAANGVATIRVESAGYYLVKDTTVVNPDDYDSVSLFMLQVVGPTTITAKAGVPTPDKKILEGETEKLTGDYNIGDTVTFVLKATLPNNYENYKTYKLVFHDKMSAGLTMGQVQSITLTKKDTTVAPVTLDDPATYIATAPYSDGCTLEVSFDDLTKVFTTAGNGDTITVTYTATVNSNAVTGNPGNDNEMHLEFSNNPNDNQNGTGKTPDKEVLVFTYELDNNKVDATDNNIKLQGAEFKLQNNNGDDRELNGKWLKIDSENKVSEWVEDENEASVLTSGADGLFKVIGLDAGTYTLKETKAPAGYNLPDPATTTIVITATMKNSYDGTADSDDAVLESLTITVGDKTENGATDTGIVSTTITNGKGATLPETGGIGTTIFYVVGGLLTVAAVVLLVTKKRMSADK